LRGDGEKVEAEDQVKSTAGVTNGDAAVERAKSEQKAGSPADGSPGACRQEDQVMSPRGKAAVKAPICKFCRKTFTCAMGRNGHLRHCKERLAIKETQAKTVEYCELHVMCDADCCCLASCPPFAGLGVLMILYSLNCRMRANAHKTMLNLSIPRSLSFFLGWSVPWHHLGIGTHCSGVAV
jgi:hypothetical protein